MRYGRTYVICDGKSYTHLRLQPILPKGWMLFDGRRPMLNGLVMNKADAEARVVRIISYYREEAKKNSNVHVNELKAGLAIYPVEPPSGAMIGLIGSVTDPIDEDELKAEENGYDPWRYDFQRLMLQARSAKEHDDAATASDEEEPEVDERKIVV